MSRFIKKHSAKHGMSPGSLVHVGTETDEKAAIQVIDYTPEKIKEMTVENIQELLAFRDRETTTWINVTGVRDSQMIAEIGEIFNIHPLSLEDIMNTGQRPKLEDFNSYLLLSLKMLTFGVDTKRIDSEQVSILLLQNCVVTFQEKKGDVFDHLRERIRKGNGRIRTMKTDYLAYCLIDAIIDNYFIVLENIAEKLEELEETIVSRPEFKTLQAIYHWKQELLFMRKAVWPLRDMRSALQDGVSTLLTNDTDMFYRDIHDHTIQVIDTMEIYRDMISGIKDLYLSSASNRMNEVMKVLTIFAAIFIPLTFVAGIYGMNFEYMPELSWRWGYFGALGLMLLMALGMLLFFKKNKWL